MKIVPTDLQKFSGKDFVLEVTVTDSQGTGIPKVPTGMVYMKDKKPNPIGRALTGPDGKVRYALKYSPQLKYALIIVSDGKFKMKTLHFPEQKKLEQRTYTFDNEGIESFHVIAEPLNQDFVRMTVFIALHLSKKRMLSLPIDSHATGLVLGKKLTTVQAKIQKGKLVVPALLPTGKQQLRYSFQLPLKEKQLHASFLLPNIPLLKGSLFLHPKIEPHSSLGKKLQSVKVGKEKLSYSLYSMSPAKKKDRIEFTLQDHSVYETGWWATLKKTYQSKQRNKVYGLGILFLCSLFGLFTLLRPNRKTETQSS